MPKQRLQSFISRPSPLPVGIVAAWSARALQFLFWWLQRPRLWVPRGLLLWQKLQGVRILVR